jgi:dGTP triphosphohydrolase
MAEKFELKDLKKFAALSTNNETKDYISKCTAKIMNTLEFRKLAGKTQVILSLTGPDVRTRLTHTIEVAKIAKDICVGLGLNAELAEAMALAHDIGHTPFGHVGERTLREIMCGCDTLGNKIRDDDFDNSGFKHNLQSFRILKDLAKVDQNNNTDEAEKLKSIWPYIFWGAPAHTKMSYAKPGAGMDDEILISSIHCDWVYVCHYHEKKECKRNIQYKKGRGSELNKKEICKPWYCAKLKPMDDQDNVEIDRLQGGESTREYLKKEPIKKQYLNRIFCSNKCYLAKLWKHKQEKEDITQEYPFLFDHPFPNSYYADSINEYFKGIDANGYISLEAIVVQQADEIAQRQQDLEDGVKKGLLPFNTAKTEDVKEMISTFDNNGISDFGKYSDNLDKANKAEDLGKLLVDFYKDLLISQTKKNVSTFAKKQKNPEKISIYCVMNILYEMKASSVNTKISWLLEEFKKKSFSKNTPSKKTVFNDIFELNEDTVYLCLLAYHQLEKYSKQFDDNKLEEMIDLLSKCIQAVEPKPDCSDSLCELKMAFKRLKQTYDEFEKNKDCPYEKIFYWFLKSLDKLREFLSKNKKEQYDDYFKPKKKDAWKSLGDLNLHHFYILYQISQGPFTEKLSKKGEQQLIISDDLKGFKVTDDYSEERYTEIFEKWKTVQKIKSNIVLTELVSFTDKRNHDADIEDIEENKRDALDEFEKKQCNTILKSEPVEKNDGKANYILRRLFKAYIANSHQLPDTGLRYILSCLLNKKDRDKLIENEVTSSKEILKKLKKTLVVSKSGEIIDDISDNEYFIEMAKCNYELKELNPTPKKSKDLKLKIKDGFRELTNNTSNEVKAALENRKKLYNYLIKLKETESDTDKKISGKLFSDNEEDKKIIKNNLRQLRAILDNPILNAIPFWQSILSRAICDYIASLTDQEAVNEYEKLYAGIMELV